MTPGIRSKLPRLAPILTSSVVLGIDISQYQHPNGAAINWAQVAGAGVKQVYVKATEGTGIQNPYFHADVADARAAGIDVGAYHFCWPALNTPSAEVDYFRSYVGAAPVNLPAALDDETQINRPWVLEWLSLWGDPGALHYSDQNFLTALGNLGYRQWTARPGATGLYPGDYATQFSSAPLSGISGGVDMDYFDPAGAGMTEAQMQAFLDGLAQTIPGQTTFAGWMSAVLQTEQQNFNSLSALAKVVGALSGAAPMTLTGTIEDQGAGKSSLTGTATPV